MKKTPSAKQLTFLYFSIVAFALIAIHVSVYWQTTEGLERLYGENRLNQVKAHIADHMSHADLSGRGAVRIEDPGLGRSYGSTEIVFDFRLLPDWFPNPDDMEWDAGLEVLSKSSDEAYFIMKTQLETATGMQDAMLVMDFSLYELTEAQLFASHAEQIAISLVLLVISLIVVIKISDRLTHPISSFARILATKPTEDLSPVPLPPGTQTRELVDMVESFNRYLARLETLVERERSFSRYASHEMRSPLTVMKGALTLIEESDDPKFQAKQRKRLDDSIREMSELIETLLSLTRVDSNEEIVTRELKEEEIQDIAVEHEYLLTGKPISWRVDVSGGPEIRMPMETLRILLGNLVKNAFNYAEQGEVLIEALPGEIRVSDSGATHTDRQHLEEGYGLGLLLVRDICHRYGWRTWHEGNDNGGWTTHVTFDTGK